MKNKLSPTFVKGIQKLGAALALLFIGPAFVHLIVSNKEKPFYIPLLIIGILLCIAAVFFLYSGLKTIVKSLFDKD